MKKEKTIKLYELPNNTKIFSDGISDGSKYIIFDHPDGMYSYCVTEKGNVLHLFIGAELEKRGEDYYLVTDNEIDN